MHAAAVESIREVVGRCGVTAGEIETPPRYPESPWSGCPNLRVIEKAVELLQAWSESTSLRVIVKTLGLMTSWSGSPHLCVIVKFRVNDCLEW